MASQKKMNDSTSFQPSDAPILCANGRGFFRTAATMNLCSKCYRDHKMHEDQVAMMMAAIEKSMSSAPPTPKVVVAIERAVEAQTVMAVPSTSQANWLSPLRSCIYQGNSSFQRLVICLERLLCCAL